MIVNNMMFRFAMVGIVGFCTDAGLLHIGINIFGFGPIIARIPSFTIAVLVTWYLNRKYTFGIPDKSFTESFPPYLSSNFVGMLLNFGIYSFAILWMPDSLGRYPLLALAVGAAVSMVFNYVISRYFIFKPDSK